MKPGARVALGVGIGYFLGRTKKMRVAMMLAGAGVTGKLPSNPQELLQRSASMLGSSPEINKITESVRGELMHAARAAAVTAASHRIDALNERLQSRGAGAGNRADEEPEDAEYEDEYDESRDEEEGRGSRSRRSSRSRDEEPDYDEADEESAGEEDSGDEDSGDEEEPEPERPAPRRRAARATPRPRTSRSKKTADSEDSDDSEEAPPKPRKRAARSSASSSGRAPVRRTKR